MPNKSTFGEDIPVGIRPPGNDQDFRLPSTDRSIVPDTVSPPVEGYFRIPPIWIGEAPHEAATKRLNPIVHHEVVYTATLRCGIEVCAQRDGTFAFDFTNWPAAAVVVIPGYKRPSLDGAVRLPRAHHEAQQKAERHAALRAQVMNVHQACLTTTERTVRQRSAGMGFPITAWTSLKGINFQSINAYHNDSENPSALARNAINNFYDAGSRRQTSRRIIEDDVVSASFSLLDRILMDPDDKLLYLVESAFIAACRMREGRYGEALALSWIGCEQLISSEWRKHIATYRQNNPLAVSKERMEKLNARDYTASVMVEMLELNGKIDNGLYRMLEIARKARNRWAHEMRVPREQDTHITVKALQMLLAKFRGIELHLQTGGRSGVPEWPYWLWTGATAR